MVDEPSNISEQNNQAVITKDNLSYSKTNKTN